MYRGYSNGFCDDIANTGQPGSAEVFASDSMCFMSTASPTGARTSTYRDECGDPVAVYCHRRQCVNDGTSSAKLRVYLRSDNTYYVDCPVNGGTVDVYANLNTRISPCADDMSWKTGYARPAGCKDFVSSGCSAYQDMGQFTKCPVTCGTCAAFTGTITCPAVQEVCTTTSSSSSKSLSTTEIVLITLGSVAAVAGVLFFFRKKLNIKKFSSATRESLIVPADKDMGAKL
jgi:hypothetical protein